MATNKPITEDQFLRQFKFVIDSRPKSGQARWRRGAKVLTQDQAMKVARREREQKDAEKAQGIEL